MTSTRSIPATTPKGPPEDHIQHAVARVLDELGVLWCHVANEAVGELPNERGVRGGPRTQAQQARILRATQLVGMGLKAGVPDVLVFTPPPARLEARGVALELKSSTGRVSQDQTRWLAALRDQGWVTFVERSFEDAMHALEMCGWAVDEAQARCRARGEWWDGSRWSRPSDRAAAEKVARRGGW